MILMKKFNQIGQEQLGRPNVFVNMNFAYFCRNGSMRKMGGRICIYLDQRFRGKMAKGEFLTCDDNIKE